MRRPRVALDLAHDVAEDPAEIGSHAAQRPVGALELLGVGVALVGDQRVLADPLIGLAQPHAVPLGQPHQPLARPMHQLGVGRERHRLRLHRRVDDDLGEVRGLRRAGARRRVQALLDQRDELLLAHPLAPARQRRAVERQLVPEELLAAEELEIRVLDPALAELLVGQVVRVLEDRQPRHQPRRQRRLAGLVRIDRAEPLLQKAPVDRRGQLRQRMAQVDDLVEPGAEKIVLTAVPTLLRPHRESLPSPLRRQRITPRRPTQFARSRPARPRKPAKTTTSKSPQTPANPGVSGFFTDDKIHREMPPREQR